MSDILETRDISKKFGKVSVIENATFGVHEGEKHALIGPNGAGKSTLFNLMTGKYKPTSGQILFRDRRVDGLRPYTIARLGIARSFQITNIFPGMTVFENMRNAVASKNRVGLKISRRLDRMDRITTETERILERIRLKELGSETADTLAYGQQRALELGMTIALDPQLIMLDEPTAGMTPEETGEIIGLIRSVTESITLLIIEHDLDVVFNLADRISVLHYGKIITTGSPEEIKANETVREAYLGDRTV